MLDMKLKTPQEYTSQKVLCQHELGIIQKTTSKARNRHTLSRGFDHLMDPNNLWFFVSEIFFKVANFGQTEDGQANNLKLLLLH